MLTVPLATIESGGVNIIVKSFFSFPKISFLLASNRAWFMVAPCSAAWTFTFLTVASTLFLNISEKFGSGFTVAFTLVVEFLLLLELLLQLVKVRGRSNSNATKGALLRMFRLCA